MLCGDRFLPEESHHMINLNLYKTGDGTKLLWGDDIGKCGLCNKHATRCDSAICLYQYVA